MLIRKTCIEFVKKKCEEIYENANEKRKGYSRVKLETLLVQYSIYRFADLFVERGSLKCVKLLQEARLIKARKPCMIYEDENTLKKEQTSKKSDVNR